MWQFVASLRDEFQFVSGVNTLLNLAYQPRVLCEWAQKGCLATQKKQIPSFVRKMSTRKTELCPLILKIFLSFIFRVQKGTSLTAKVRPGSHRTRSTSQQAPCKQWNTPWLLREFTQHCKQHQRICAQICCVNLDLWTAHECQVTSTRRGILPQHCCFQTRN